MQPSSMRPVEATIPYEDNAFFYSSLPMDDEDFVYVAELFMNGLRDKAEQMVNALTPVDFDKLYRLGHWLKGSSGSAGYDELS